VDELTRRGPIDEYRFVVHPVIVGAGKLLFSGHPTATLRLVDVKTTATGVVVSTYEKTADPSGTTAA
jgi:dihydrofolate reductase